MSVTGGQQRKNEPVTGMRRKDMLSWDAKELLELLDIIDKEGRFNRDVWTWIKWEEVGEFKDDDDLDKFLHEEVPEVIKSVAREIGARAYVYHKKDAVPGPEYIVLLKRGGKKYTLEVDCDPYEPEEKGTCTLFIVDAWRGWSEPTVHYHPI